MYKQVHIHNELDIFVVLILMFWYKESNISHKGAAILSFSMRGLNSQCSDRGNIASCQFSSTRVPHDTETVHKRQFQGRGQGNTGKMTTRLEWTSVTLNTCVSFQLRPGSGDIHTCCFDFAALYLCSTANNWEIKILKVQESLDYTTANGVNVTSHQLLEIDYHTDNELYRTRVTADSTFLWYTYMC